MKRLAIMLSAAFVLSLGIGFVIGAPQDGQSTAGQIDQWAVTNANSVAAGGGNITEVNVTSNQTTEKWQGFWGNVSGSLHLGDGTDTLYDWNGVTFQAVYAGLSDDIDWANINQVNSTTAPDLDDIDAQFGYVGNEVDSVNQTFSGGTCGAGTIFATSAGVTPYTQGGGAGSWETCIGRDTGAAKTDVVFGTAIVSAGATAWNGNTVQYQLMVPTDSTGELYFMYLEI